MKRDKIQVDDVAGAVKPDRDLATAPLAGVAWPDRAIRLVGGPGQTLDVCIRPKLNELAQSRVRRRERVVVPEKVYAGFTSNWSILLLLSRVAAKGTLPGCSGTLSHRRDSAIWQSCSGRVVYQNKKERKSSEIEREKSAHVHFPLCVGDYHAD